MGFLRRLTRRELVRDGALAAGALVLPEAAFGSEERRRMCPARRRSPPARTGRSGPRTQLPGCGCRKGFKVREIGRSRAPVGLTGYFWPDRPDGSGSFAQPDGSWISSPIQRSRTGAGA